MAQISRELPVVTLIATSETAHVRTMDLPRCSCVLKSAHSWGRPVLQPAAEGLAGRTHINPQADISPRKAPVCGRRAQRLGQPTRIAGQIRLHTARQQPNRGRLLGAALVALQAQQRVLL